LQWLPQCWEGSDLLNPTYPAYPHPLSIRASLPFHPRLEWGMTVSPITHFRECPLRFPSLGTMDIHPLMRGVFL